MTDIAINQVWSMVPTSKLKPYENNAKLHPEKQVKKIAASIREFGWQGSPIEVDDNFVIVNGHGRHLAAQSLGMPEVPCIVVDATEARNKAYRLVDNEVAESKYDTHKIAIELSELSFDDDLGVDLSDFWSKRDIDFTLGDLGDIEEEAFTLDIESEVEDRGNVTNAAIDNHEEGAYSLSRIFGFSKVSARQQRALTKLKAHIEHVTGEEGAAALTAFALDYVGVEGGEE